MIVFRSFNNQLVIKGDEYAIMLKDGGIDSTGLESENLVIHTPQKKYTFLGINGGKYEGYEVMEKILDYIRDNITKEIIYIDMNELTGSEYVSETIIASLEVSDS